MLVSPALNPALREARFDGDASLDAAGARAARAAAPHLPAADRYAVGASARCAATARELGLPGAESPEAAPVGWALGRWAGLRLDEVAAAEPEALAAWTTDPEAAPHGGESLRGLLGRVGSWLDAEAWAADGPGGEGPGARRRPLRLLAVVEPAVVRAAATHALGLPPAAFWRLDVGPLTLTALTGRPGRWNLATGHALAPAGAVRGEG
ncbi:histidine phosphatase family protein [Streptomyces sp. NPDC058372]|uniref:histidine phosphatase family protein n=1 Tax=Streptomyces sp. NPDC058372 TaxID=3346464 RepID=UPI003648ACA5